MFGPEYKLVLSYACAHLCRRMCHIYISSLGASFLGEVLLVKFMTLYLHASQVRVTAGDSGLRCGACVTSFERWLTPLCVENLLWSQKRLNKQTLINTWNRQWKRRHSWSVCIVSIWIVDRGLQHDEYRSFTRHVRSVWRSVSCINFIYS